MKRNTLKVLSSLAILGIASLGLASCANTNATSTPVETPAQSTPAPTTPTPTTPAPTTPAPTTPAAKTLKNISVTGLKTEYVAGEAFTFENAVVTKTYSDDSQEEAKASEIAYKIYSDEECTKEVSSIETVGKYYVKVTVENKNKIVEITVQDRQAKVTELVQMSALTTGKDIQEKVDIYSANGNEVYVTANSSRKISIEENKKTFEGVEYTKRLSMGGSSFAAGESVEVDAQGNVLTGRVLVIKVAKAGKIRVLGMPSANDYRSFVLTNLADYSKTIKSNKDKSNVGAYEFDVQAGTYYFYCGPTDDELGTSAGGYYIYGVEISYNVPASSITYSELKVETAKAKTDFNVGDEFTSNGLVVKGLNNYGAWDVLQDYEIKNAEGQAVSTAKAGKQTVTVSAKGLTATYDIQVINPNAKTESIAIKTQADKLVYKQGEELSLEGIVLTATDSDNLVQDVQYTAESADITYKVLNGENDVTSSFKTLTKGSYKVELTYDSVSTSYNVTVLEEKEGKFSCDEVVAIGSEIYLSSVTISYTDGTDTDWSKYNVTVKSSDAEYETKLYSDEACTTEIADAKTAFAQVGTVYAKLTYKTYTKTIALTVKNVSSSESYSTKDLVNGTDYKGQTLFTGNYVNVSVGSGTCKGESKSEINNGTVLIKLDENIDKDKCIVFEVKQKITLKIYLNASGSDKKYQIVDASGAAIKTGTASNSAENTVIEITLEAGTYKLAATAGGMRFAGIEATKAE